MEVTQHMVVPASNLYEDTKVDPVHTMEDVYKLLDKFGITEKRLTEAGAENSFLEFIVRQEFKPAIKIKISIPFIEMYTGRGYNKQTTYDKPRSFRFFYHYLKALLSAKEAEIKTMEEIFMAHIVTMSANGEITLGEQLSLAMANGNAPALEGFTVMPLDTSNQLPPPKEQITRDPDKILQLLSSSESKNE